MKQKYIAASPLGCGSFISSPDVSRRATYIESVPDYVVHSFHRPDVSRRATYIESVPDYVVYSFHRPDVSHPATDM